MATLFLPPEEQGIVVFKVCPAMTYGKRLALAFGLIAAGLVLQILFFSFWPCAFVFAGNLFLLVRGYDNTVDVGAWDAAAKWERVEWQRLVELESLDRKMKRWDLATIDISNSRGCLAFAVVGGAIFLLLRYGFVQNRKDLQLIGIDAALLLVPHWITGTRSILTKPNLILKIGVLRKLVASAQPQLKGNKVDYFMLLKGQETSIPDDVKIRVHFQNQHPDFLGFYGQVVTNAVKGTAYPYFYVVLVAKRGFGLEEAFVNYTPAYGLTKEFKDQEDVEVLVIRQTTTKTSGYHTNDSACLSIFKEGLDLAERVAVKA